MRGSLRLALLLAVACTALAAAQHIDYQRPVNAAPTVRDIGSGYSLPVVQRPMPRPTWREVADTGVLAAGLGLSAWLTLWRRSRAGMLLLAAGGVAYFGFYRQGCICPIGSIQNIALALVDPHYAVSYFVILFFLLPLIAALFFGRVFCGGVCPLGAIQELVALSPLQVPRRIDRALVWLRWLYLGLAVWLATRPALAPGAGWSASRDFIICRFDPFVGFFRFTGPFGVMLWGAGLLVLGVFIGRPYCRYLCPYGALLSVLSRFAWRNVSITPNKELDCGLCEEACPYGAIEGWRARRSACVACARCYSHCPRQRLCAGAAIPPNAGPGSGRVEPT